MPSRSLNRRRSEAAASGYPGNYGRVAAFNGCNDALNRTDTPGQKPPFAGMTSLTQMSASVENSHLPAFFQPSIDLPLCLLTNY